MAEEHQKEIFESLRLYKNKLDLNSMSLQDTHLKDIAIYLGNEDNLSLELLHLGSNEFTDDGLIDLLLTLQLHTNLRELYLGNNEFTELGLMALIDILPNFKLLRILSLGNCHLTDENFVQLCYKLPELPEIEQLFLQQNEITDESFPCLIILLISGQLSSLRVLHIGENQLTYTIKQLFESLNGNTHLKSLYLNNISMDIKTIEILAECLHNCSLEVLNLSNTGFTNQAGSIIYKVLKRSKLQALYLNNNHLNDQSVMELIDRVEKQSMRLSYVGLFQNSIDDEVLIQDLLELLIQHNIVDELPKKIAAMKQTKQEDSEVEEETKKYIDENEFEDEKKPFQGNQNDPEEEEDDEEKQLEELDQDFSETVALESKVWEKEQVIPKEGEKMIEIDEKQGKLKTFKWVGETCDPLDKNFIHSKLE